MAEKQDPLGKDIKLKFDTIGADLIVNAKGDFETISEEDNLAQAIINRLATSKGELHDIGHPDYGSRLFEVIGEINNKTTRQRIKAIVQECLDQESRIEKITRINVIANPNPYNPNQVNIELTILPVKRDVFLTVTYPFRLEG
jgi:phage baseplate assembly protein W